MYAIIETGGKQYKVEPDSIIKIEKIEGEKGDSITIDKVLALSNNGELKVGAPYVANATVTATIHAQIKGEKITVFRYKPKKRIRVKTGHRQKYTALKVTGIKAGK